MKQIKKVGIVNGGGDTPGLNAVIEAVVKAGSKHGIEFIGFIEGSEGMLDTPRYLELNPEIVDDISAVGGTILHTTNKGKFSAKKGAGETRRIPEEILNEAIANLHELEVDALVIIGGDGTLSGAVQLQEKGVKVVGVPKTIDNDLCHTDRTFGFSSAVEFVSDSLDRLHTTADSHSRVIVVETMSRNAGWIALYGGVAGNSDIILIPEIPYTYENVISQLRTLDQKGQNYFLITMAEGAKARGSSQAVTKSESDKENLLGGGSQRLIAEIEQRMKPDEFELRNVVLGHLQRGGSPNAEDRILAEKFGVAAIKTVLAQDWGKMMALRGEVIERVEITDACESVRGVSMSEPVLQTARELGIYFGN